MENANQISVESVVIADSVSPTSPEQSGDSYFPVSKHFNKDGSVDIKVNGWVYVHINYDYRYTSNYQRAELARRIMEML